MFPEEIYRLRLLKGNVKANGGRRALKTKGGPCVKIPLRTEAVLPKVLKTLIVKRSEQERLAQDMYREINNS